MEARRKLDSLQEVTTQFAPSCKKTSRFSGKLAFIGYYVLKSIYQQNDEGEITNLGN